MRKLFIILLFIPIHLFAVNHYIATGGGGLGTLVSPFATIAQSNAHTYVAGDSLLFNRGDTFTGTIIITQSGTSGNHIIIGAYGTGVDPIITGFITVTSWVNDGDGLYHKAVTMEDELGILSAYNSFLVTVDGINTPRGRYPNAGWLTYESTNGSTTITDNELTGVPDWTGAEAVIRKVRWMTDRNVITNHSITTLTFTKGTNWWTTANYGYYIQNSLLTLDALGEWYYDGTNLYMYFGVADPADYVVKMATRNNLVYMEGVSYQTYDNINFIGANVAGFYVRSAGNIIIQNCSISYIGAFGIYSPANSVNASVTVNNCIITECNSNAIELRGTNSYGWIKYNTISNIGLIQGSCTQFPYDNWGDGVAITANSCLVEYNRITNVGHTGIRFSYGNDIIIRYNVINGFGYTRYDAGGIYSWNPEDGSVTPTGQKVQNNIVLNCNQTISGIGGDTDPYLWGIYLDVFSANIEITYNTVSNCYAGLVIYASKNITASGNTCYNNKLYQIYYVWYGVGDGYPLTGLDVQNNKFICKNPTEYSLGYYSLLIPNPSSIGTLNYNYYARPIDDDDVFLGYYDYGYDIDYYTLATWKTFSGQDVNSNVSLGGTVDNVNKLHFVYNDTTINKTITLSTGMKDVANTDYAGTFYIEPFTSLVLIGAGTVTEGFPEDPEEVGFPTVTTTAITIFNAYQCIIGGTIISDGGGAISAAGVCYSTSINPTTADSKIANPTTTEIAFSDILRGLTTGTVYHLRAYATNGSGTSYGSDISYTVPVCGVLESGGVPWVTGGKIMIFK